MAFYLFKKSAEKGNAKGALNLGHCYVCGRGTDKNMEEGRAWLLKSSHPRAQILLKQIQDEENKKNFPNTLHGKIGDSVEDLKKIYGVPADEQIKGHDAQLTFEQGFYKYMFDVRDNKTEFIIIEKKDKTEIGPSELRSLLNENLEPSIKWEPENCGWFVLFKSQDGSKIAAFFEPMTTLKIFTKERETKESLIEKWKEKNQIPKPPKNFPSLESLKANSARGDLSADYNLAMAYFAGWGCKRDPCEALRIWERLANTKSQFTADSQYKLACLYFTGDGTVKDEVKAFEWMKKAAENNHPGGQANIGFAYSTGSFGFKKDTAEGLKWTQKAVDQGERMAEFNLGVMYLDGCGVQKDTERGLKLIQSAADKGYDYAKTFLEKRKTQSATNPQ